MTLAMYGAPRTQRAADHYARDTAFLRVDFCTFATILTRDNAARTGTKVERLCSVYCRVAITDNRPQCQPTTFQQRFQRSQFVFGNRSFAEINGDACAVKEAALLVYAGREVRSDR